MIEGKIDSCAGLIDYINEIGFLPLLGNRWAPGWSAEEAVDASCRYVVLPDGGWEWPLWQWKGDIVKDSGCAYGKFFMGAAGFVSRRWWPYFCQLRRSFYRFPEEGSVEETILRTLEQHGSMITRDLRAACGFSGPKMRGRFDTYIARLQRACRIVTEDFVYPVDKHGRQYGWGWALLTTPERLFGADACKTDDMGTQEVYDRLAGQMKKILPDATPSRIDSVLFR